VNSPGVEVLDLVPLKMLVISGSVPECHALSEAAAAAPVPIQVVEHMNLQDGLLACEMFARDNFDFVFLDSEMPGPGRIAVLAAARKAETRPLAILIARATSKTNEAAADGFDYDDVLVKPVNRQDAQNVIERCARARLPNRVLIVDDSAVVRSIVRKVLGASRFRLHVEEADEGITALAQMRSGRFDIVFLDCNMPGLDGFSTLTEIKRKHPHTHVVMITATRDESIAQRAYAAGAKAFLYKPFFSGEVDRVLHIVFGLNAPKSQPVSG
jgi:CheY-like chemotaxis protein